jgi:hypothetical protein
MDQETEPIKEASTGAEKETTPFRVASTVDRAASAIRNQDMPNMFGGEPTILFEFEPYKGNVI